VLAALSKAGPWLRNAGWALGVTGALLAIPAAPAPAETLSLSPAEAILTAQAAYQAGHFELSNRIAHALLLVDSHDPHVLLLLAATEPKLGRPKSGLSYGKRAWAEARQRDAPDAFRWEIARNTAKAAYTSDQLALAQFWLRRSLDVAPQDEAKRISARDLQDVRAQSPLRWRLGLTAGPSDNLNGGATDLVFRIDDTVVGSLGTGAVAIGGLRGRLSFGADYALASGSGGQTIFGMTGDVLLHKIDGSDRTKAGSLRSKDLNQTKLGFSLRRDIAEGPGGVPVGVSLRAEGNWVGGRWAGPSIGVSGAVRAVKGERGSLWLATGAERRWTAKGDLPQDVLQLTGNGVLSLTGDQTLSFALSLERAVSDRPNAEYDAVTLSLGYDPAFELGPARLDFMLRLGHRQYEKFTLGFAEVTRGRSDFSYAVGVNLTLDDWDVMGFAPVVSVDLGRTRSNVSRYETRTHGINFSFRQLF
jgi:hypothetical protein